MTPAFVLWIGAAVAADGELEVLVGGRTAPDAALEQPREWEPEIEPTLVSALVARARSTSGEAWWGVEGSAWGTLPEADAVLFSLGPRAGIGADAGAGRLELAARYDAQVYPWSPTATNGRAEGLVKGAFETHNAVPQLTVEATDRHYPYQTTWSFRAVEPGVGVVLRSTDQHLRARLAGSWQLNRGFAPTGAAVTGEQLRGSVDLGWTSHRWEVWTAYRIIRAWGEETEDPASRALFTPIGDYSADADVLSAGGFRHTGWRSERRRRSARGRSGAPRSAGCAEPTKRRSGPTDRRCTVSSIWSTSSASGSRAWSRWAAAGCGSTTVERSPTSTPGSGCPGG